MSDSEVRMLAERIREKDRLIRASTQTENRNAFIAASLMAVVTMAAATRAQWFWAHVGFALCAASYLAAACVLWLYRRRARRRPELGLEARGYYEELVAFHDREIRFLTTAKYWYVAPILIGVALIGWGIWAETGNKITSLLVGVVIPIVGWVTIYYLNDIRTIGDLRARKHQIRQWMSEAGLD
jgi:hypothetical protein